MNLTGSVTVHTLVIKRASRMRREQMERGGEIHPEDTLIPIIQKASEDILRDYGYLPVLYVPARKIRQVPQEIQIRKMLPMQNQVRSVYIIR